MPRILVADDHAIVRKGLKQVLSETPDLVVSDEASNGEEVLDKVRREVFDLVILDISMPGRGGLDTLKQLQVEWPRLPVLILSMHPEEQYALRVLRAGASGYLTKESIPEELVTAIRKIIAGRKYVSLSLAEKWAHHLSNEKSKSLHESLSDREHHVFCMIGKGQTVSEIASDLYLSPKTVSTYRSRVLKKLGLKNNAELVRYAIKEGLVD